MTKKIIKNIVRCKIHICIVSGSDSDQGKPDVSSEESSNVTETGGDCCGSKARTGRGFSMNLTDSPDSNCEF